MTPPCLNCVGKYSAPWLSIEKMRLKTYAQGIGVAGRCMIKALPKSIELTNMAVNRLIETAHFIVFLLCRRPIAGNKRILPAPFLND